MIKNGIVRPREFMKELAQKVRSCQGCQDRRQAVVNTFNRMVRRPQQQVPPIRRGPR